MTQTIILAATQQQSSPSKVPQQRNEAIAGFESLFDWCFSIAVFGVIALYAASVGIWVWEENEDDEWE